MFALFVFVALSFSSFDSAAKYPDNFVVDTVILQDSIPYGESGILNISIMNRQDVTDTFKVYISNDMWSTTTSPIYVYQTEYGLSIAPQKTESFKLYAKPFSSLIPGLYNVNIVIESRNAGDIYTKNVLMAVRGQGVIGEYVPVLRTDVVITNNGKLDPRQESEILVKLDNLNPLNLSNISLILHSSFFDFKRTTSLGPLEQKNELFTVSFNPIEAPKKDMLSITIKRGDEIIKNVKTEFEIISYTDLKLDRQEKLGVLKKQFIYTYTNNGNVNRQETVKFETNLATQAVTKTIPQATITKENRKEYLTWYVTFKPQETYKIIVEYNYQLLFFIVLVITGSIIAYYIFRSPVVIKKEVSIADKQAEEVSQLKILLYIKNRTGNPVKSVKVMDKVPTIAEMRDEFVVGTLKPSKVLRHEKKGTIIEWDVKFLESYEERIISYKIKSKLSILGFFNLPPAMVKFRDDKGRDKSVLSNKVRAAQK